MHQQPEKSLLPQEKSQALACFFNGSSSITLHGFPPSTQNAPWRFPSIAFVEPSDTRLLIEEKITKKNKSKTALTVGLAVASFLCGLATTYAYNTFFLLGK
jgi:hypothetical protein